MSNCVIHKLELIFAIKTFKNAKTPPKFSLTAVYKAVLVPMFPRIGQEFVPLQYIMNIWLRRLQTQKKRSGKINRGHPGRVPHKKKRSGTVTAPELFYPN